MIEWEGIWSLGKQSETYFDGEYRGMHCELFYNNRLGHAPFGWDWSFYDKNSGDPELAVARSDDSFPTKEEAEADLIRYIDGYVED